MTESARRLDFTTKDYSPTHSRTRAHWGNGRGRLQVMASIVTERVDSRASLDIMKYASAS